MADNIYILRIHDTFANGKASLDNNKTMILSDEDNEHIWKEDGKWLFPAVSKHWTGAAWSYHSTEFDDVTLYGDAYVNGSIYHRTDTDTKIAFGVDTMALYAGNVNMLQLAEDAQDTVEFNKDEVDVDIIFNSSGVSDALFIEGSTGYVGCNTNDPTAEVTIAGDIHFEDGAARTISVDQVGAGDGNTLTIAAGQDDGGNTGGDLILNAGTGDAAGQVEINVGDFVFNENGGAYGARFETDTKTHALYITDGGIGINESTIDADLHITSATSAKPLIKIENQNADEYGSRIEFHKISGSEADNDAIGVVSFNAHDSEDNVDEYATITAYSTDVTTTDEAGSIVMECMIDGTLRDFITMDGYAADQVGEGIIVFNDEGRDLDMRWESDANANGMVWDAGTGHIGINEGSPDEMLHLTSSTSTKPVLRLENTADDTSGPRVSFYKIRGAAADNDQLGSVYGFGRTDTGSTEQFVYTSYISSDVSNAAKAGKIIHYVRVNDNTTNLFTVNGYNGTPGQAEIIFNEDQIDCDMRWESDSNANAMVWDAGNSRVGIGLAPTYKFHVGTSSGSTAHTNGDDFVLEANDLCGMSILTPDNKQSHFYMGSVSDADFYWVLADYNAGTPYVNQYVATGGTNKLIFQMTGSKTEWNPNGSDMDFKWEGDTDQNLLLLDAGDDSVNIGIAAGVGAKLNVGGSIKISELAAAVADTAGYGQLWVKNTTPCELWFTDDAGTDHQVAYV